MQADFIFSEATADEFTFEEAPRMAPEELVRKVVDHAPSLFHVLHQAGKAMGMDVEEVQNG